MDRLIRAVRDTQLDTVTRADRVTQVVRVTVLNPATALAVTGLAVLGLAALVRARDMGVDLGLAASRRRHHDAGTTSAGWPSPLPLRSWREPRWAG